MRSSLINIQERFYIGNIYNKLVLLILLSLCRLRIYRGNRRRATNGNPNRFHSLSDRCYVRRFVWKIP